MSDTKKMLGQFFTITNPFNIDIFYKWYKLIDKSKKEIIIEPFAGANNICKMISDLGIITQWSCYDISPSDDNVMPQFKIEKRDTLSNFPEEYYVGITNPPYLAKNSATRAKIDFPETSYDDLYKFALDIMLNNLEYVAAIIPESFINSELFHNRLFACISLTCKMFNDTDCPVCLALFIPEKEKKKNKLDTNDFYIYSQNRKIGKYQTIKKKQIKSNETVKSSWKFNDRLGEIGIKCVDNTSTASIEFILGNQISSDSIKVSSRALTRISGLPENIEVDTFISKCNEVLRTYREDTCDIFLTSFKGLRKDDKYRRRLDFKTAKNIMDTVLKELSVEGDIE